MNKVIVLDNGFFMFRAIHIFRKKCDIPMAWYYLKMIIANLKKLKIDLDDLVIIAKDSPYGSWRKDIVKEYKSTRKQKREELESKSFWDEMWKETDKILKKINDYSNFHVVECYKTEADDIASVSCRVFRDKEVILVASDTDWEQLAFYSNVKIFSPISKKFKNIKNPLKVLAKKIEIGDVSDDLVTKPSTEAEFEKRRKVVSLLELPLEIEKNITEKLFSLKPKNLYLNRIPYPSIRKEIIKLYKL